MGAPSGQTGVAHASGDAAHAADYNSVLVSGLQSSGRNNHVCLSRQEDGGVVAVSLPDTGTGNTVQSHVLLVDGHHITGILQSRTGQPVIGGVKCRPRIRCSRRGIIVAALAGLVTGAKVYRIIGNLGQGISAVLVHAVSAPSVHQGADASAITIGIIIARGELLVLSVAALVHVDLNGLNVAVQGNDIALGGLVGQIAGAQINTGQEGVVGLALNDLHADGVAIGIEVHVVGGVLHVGLAVLIQNLDVVLGSGGVVVLGAVHLDPATVLEGADAHIADHLNGGDGLDGLVSHSDQNDVVLLHVLNGEVLAGDLDGLGAAAGAAHGIGILHQLLGGGNLLHAPDVEGDLVLLGVVVGAGLG